MGPDANAHVIGRILTPMTVLCRKQWCSGSTGERVWQEIGMGARNRGQATGLPSAGEPSSVPTPGERFPGLTGQEKFARIWRHAHIRIQVPEVWQPVREDRHRNACRGGVPEVWRPRGRAGRFRLCCPGWPSLERRLCAGAAHLRHLTGTGGSRESFEVSWFPGFRVTIGPHASRV